MSSAKIFPHRVLRGSHSEGGRTYRKGQVVDSKSNLSKLHNKPGSIKFLAVEADAQDNMGVTDLIRKGNTDLEVLHTREELSTLSRADLMEIAKDEEIELGPTMKKEDIIIALLAT